MLSAIYRFEVRYHLTRALPYLVGALLGLLAFVAVYLAIRMARPEQLVDPEVFDSVLTYVASLRTPSSPWLPSTWAYNALHAALEGTPGRGALKGGMKGIVRPGGGQPG